MHQAPGHSEPAEDSPEKKSVTENFEPFLKVRTPRSEVELEKYRQLTIEDEGFRPMLEALSQAPEDGPQAL